jgi:hypothetical protein
MSGGNFLYIMYFGLQEAKPPPCPLLLNQAREIDTMSGLNFSAMQPQNQALGQEAPNAGGPRKTGWSFSM